MTTYLLGVVAVLRKCRQCGEWKPVPNFRSGGHSWGKRCKDCRTPGPHPGVHGTGRGLAITDSGREYLASLKQGAA